MTKRSLPFPPQLALLFGILAVSTASIFIRYSQNYATSLVVAAYRLLIAALILAPIAFTTRREELAGFKSRELRLSLLSGLFLALHFATWITSLEYTTVASSVVLVSTTPLWVALLSPITLKEPVTRKMLLGMGMALVGGVVIGISDACIVSENGLICRDAAEFIRGEAFLGNILALIGALMAAGYLMVGRKLRNQISNTSYVFIVYSMAAVILVVIVLISGNSLIGYPREAYLWFLLLAIIPQLMGHSTFNWALGYLSAAYVSISMLGEPIGSTILAYIVLDETPTLFMIFGAILIMAGIYLASLGEQKIQNL
jgi:drug/metabolite transporter (DMT)-like permease